MLYADTIGAFVHSMEDLFHPNMKNGCLGMARQPFCLRFLTFETVNQSLPLTDLMTLGSPPIFYTHHCWLRLKIDLGHSPGQCTTQALMTTLAGWVQFPQYELFSIKGTPQGATVRRERSPIQAVSWCSLGIGGRDARVGTIFCVGRVAAEEGISA